MKGNFIKLVSLFSALVLVFSLAACGEKDDVTSTTASTKVNAEAVDGSEKNEETNADLSTEPNGEIVEESEQASDTDITEDENTEALTDNSTTDKSEKTTESKTQAKTTTKKNTAKTTTAQDKTNSNKNPTAGTTKNNSNQAPAEMSVAEIVKLYNNAANATKAKQNLNVKKKEYTEVFIDDLTSSSKLLNKYEDTIISEGNSVISRLTGGGAPVITDEVFVNGKPTVNDVSKVAYLPIMESAKMSTLTANGVKSATCKKDGDGYIITIVLKSEKGTMEKKPTHHAACVNYLRLEALDLGIFNNVIKSAEMQYVDSTNSGTKFVARVNKNNLLDYMNTYMTIKGSGSGRLFGITATAKLHGTYNAEIKFIW